MPFGLQPTHLIIIAVVALIIFGPSRLPEIGRAVGKTLKEFQSATKEATAGFLSEEVHKPVEAKKEATEGLLSEEVQKPVEAKKEEPLVQVACKNCSKPINAGMKFCPECGAAQ